MLKWRVARQAAVHSRNTTETSKPYGIGMISQRNVGFPAAGNALDADIKQSWMS